MISYKQWKTINESFIGTTTTLGVSTPQSMGVMGQQMGQINSEEELLDEMKKKFAYMKDNLKKKMKKKMDGDIDDLDGEVVPPAAKKDADPEADAKAAAASDDAEVVDTDGEVDGETDSEDEVKPDKPEMMKKCMKKKMKKEDAGDEWWNSLQDMMAVQDTKNWDGWSPVEETPAAPATPAPGEVGFAPAQRIGG
jgi:hypothetical protein